MDYPRAPETTDIHNGNICDEAKWGHRWTKFQLVYYRGNKPEIVEEVDTQIPC